MPTREPVTTSGWYENTDGTWTRYGWGQFGPVARETLGSNEPRPSEEERLQKDIEPR